MAEPCPSCSAPLSTLQKVLGVRPFRFSCPTCHARLETREERWSGMLANLIAQVVFIVVFLELFGSIHAGVFWSFGMACVASLLILVIPVALFGRIRLKEK